MNEQERLPAPFGTDIDRDKTIPFMFAGTRHHGYVGDSVASALWADGVRVISRSFKYKRPRGIFSMTGFDGGALVQVGSQPNCPADRLRLVAGMPPIVGQNYRGSLARDWSAWIGLLGRFLPVGFYYRTFFRPIGAWAVFEPIIRRRAGLGRVTPDASHPPRTFKRFNFCDVCVIGSGPAGLAAALAAANDGAEVIVIEVEPAPGGSMRWSDPARGGAARDLVDAARRHSNIHILTSALALGLYADNMVAVETDTSLRKVRAKQVVVATGALEQPLIFPNNDLPGVMLASAARRLMWLYGVHPGHRAVVGTLNDDGLRTALDLVRAGLDVTAVADSRPGSAENELHAELGRSGVRVRFSAAIGEALPARRGTYFGSVLGAVRLDTVGHPGEGSESLACDLLCMAGGYAPAAALLCHAGARLAYDEKQRSLAVDGDPENVWAAGAVRGLRTTEAAHEDGAAAGHLAAAIALGLSPRGGTQRPALPTGDDRSPPIASRGGKDFVDLDEDLTVADIRNAIADGFAHVELLKRYSTAGMGPSQGKFATLSTIRIAAEALGKPPSQLGTTTARPPFTGAMIRTLAGGHASPYRLTPMHRQHVACGAQMMPAGQWYRPAYYGEPERQREAVRAEVAAVRQGVGMIDVSTLGGIDVSGPDAAAFVDRLYTTQHRNQPLGRARYALLCDDGGSIVDDGVVCRLGESRFYLTATTGAAEQTYRRLLWLNAQWRMKVDLVNLTSAFARVNVAGLKSRDVLRRLSSDIDFSADAFPFLDVRLGQIEGIEVRIFRVGFVGELGYEIHMPAPFGAALWDAIMGAGRDLGIVPFGVEAQRVLRLEKGHVIIGQDTDGLTHPYEAALDWAVAATKTEFIGRAAIEARRVGGVTRKLAGFRLDRSIPPPPECCLVIKGVGIAGRVTSAALSETCDCVIGMAYVAAEDAAPGHAIHIKYPDGRVLQALTVAMPFYDPRNDRQRI